MTTKQSRRHKLLATWPRMTGQVEHMGTVGIYPPPNFGRYIKGQIISKGLFGTLGFFQKTNKQIRFFCLTVQKTNLFVRFLEESEGTKKSFRNYLTFKK